MSTKSGAAAKSHEGTVEEQLAQLRQDLRLLADSVGKQATGQLERAQDAAAEKVSDYENQIRRNPLAATAIAAGIGFLIGALLNR